MNVSFLDDVRDLPTAKAVELYVTNGWPVFPLLGKFPAVPKDEGGDGFHDATTDIVQIREWWKRWPRANIGWALPTGTWAIDVDPRHGGDFARVMIERAIGPWPFTLRALTGSGSEHWTFDGEGPQGSAWFDGIDTRASGKGYLVIPPSIHPVTRRAYEWHTIVTPKKIPPALAALFVERSKKKVQAPIYVPPTKVDTRHLERRERLARQKIDGVIEWVRSQPKGTRNNSLFWAWMRCAEVRDVVPLSESKARLIEATAHWADNEKTKHEIEKVLR